MYTKDAPLVIGRESLYLTEGTLSELQVARTTINLLNQIDRHTEAKSVASGIAATADGLSGAAASSVSLALHDGEATLHFAGMLDDKVVCGTFQRADRLRDGDRVRAVVSDSGDVLLVHAIMNARDEFYMPLNTFASVDGMLQHCMRFAWKMTLFGWLVLSTLALFMGAFTSRDNSTGEKFIFALLILVIPPLFMFPFEYWTYRTMKGETNEHGDNLAAAIFKVFGFREPGRINLFAHSKLSMDDDGGWYGAWKGDNLVAKTS